MHVDLTFHDMTGTPSTPQLSFREEDLASFGAIARRAVELELVRPGNGEPSPADITGALEQAGDTVRANLLRVIYGGLANSGREKHFENPYHDFVARVDGDHIVNPETLRTLARRALTGQAPLPTRVEIVSSYGFQPAGGEGGDPIGTYTAPAGVDMQTANAASQLLAILFCQSVQTVWQGSDGQIFTP